MHLDVCRQRPDKATARRGGDPELRHRRDMNGRAGTRAMSEAPAQLCATVHIPQLCACARTHARKRVASTTAATSLFRAIPHLCGLLLSGPPRSSHLLFASSAAASLFRAASPPHCPPCPGRQRQTAPAAADCSAARDCQGNRNHKERCGVLRRCKRKGPLTPGTATAAPGAETRSPEHPHAARASTYSSCHSTEYYHLPQQSTLLTAFMCYACYATDMTWSYRINKDHTTCAHQCSRAAAGS